MNSSTYFLFIVACLLLLYGVSSAPPHLADPTGNLHEDKTSDPQVPLSDDQKKNEVCNPYGPEDSQGDEGEGCELPVPYDDKKIKNKECNPYGPEDPQGDEGEGCELRIPYDDNRGGIPQKHNSNTTEPSTEAKNSQSSTQTNSQKSE